MSGACQWCGTDSKPGATHCQACGAALPLEQELTGMVIPGVTDVDPAIARYRDKPLKIPRGTASEYAATHAVGVAGADPTGMLALGALAAIAVKEYQAFGSGKGSPVDPTRVGVPSEPVMEAARRLQEAQAKGETAPTDQPAAMGDKAEPA